MADYPRPTGFLRRAVDESGALVVFEAEVETMRAAYGDEAIKRATKRVAEQTLEDAKRMRPRG